MQTNQQNMQMFGERDVQKTLLQSQCNGLHTITTVQNT